MLQTYLFPKVHEPQEWNGELISKVNTLVEPLKSIKALLHLIGVVGAIIAGTTLIYRKLRGTLITTGLIYFAITSVALLALSYGFSRLISRHYAGLTEERKIELSLEKLKKSFQGLTICHTQQELDDLVKNHKFPIGIGIDAVSDVNREIIDIAFPSYHPVKNLGARFDIRKKVTLAQKLDLLETAYQKGITLRFDDYKVWLPDTLPQNGIYSPYKRYLKNKKYFKSSKQAFQCAVEFLSKRFPLPSNIDLINRQLAAFGYRFDKNDKTLGPTLLLEADGTVVMRGNCSEIGDPTWAIEKLVPHAKKIKVPRKGIDFINPLKLYDQKNWTDFQEKLNPRFPGKLEFIDEYPVALWQAPTSFDQEKVTVTETLKEAYQKMPKAK